MEELTTLSAIITVALLVYVVAFIIFRVVKLFLIWFFTSPLCLVLLFVGVCVLAYRKREAILRFWYALTPHPATRAVNHAIGYGEPIDGALFAKINEPVYDDLCEAFVRSKQAQALTARLREHEALLRAAQANELEKARKALEKQNAALRTHLNLVEAGIDHEIAAACLEEICRQSPSA